MQSHCTILIKNIKPDRCPHKIVFFFSEMNEVTLHGAKNLRIGFSLAFNCIHSAVNYCKLMEGTRGGSWFSYKNHHLDYLFIFFWSSSKQLLLLSLCLFRRGDVGTWKAAEELASYAELRPPLISWTIHGLRFRDLIIEMATKMHKNIGIKLHIHIQKSLVSMHKQILSNWIIVCKLSSKIRNWKNYLPEHVS